MRTASQERGKNFPLRFIPIKTILNGLGAYWQTLLGVNKIIGLAGFPGFMGLIIRD